MTRVLTLLLACVALVFVAGCGGDDSDSSDSGGGGGAAEKPAEPSGGSKAPAGKADVTVDMKDIKFMPANVNVKKGGTVGWVNKDSVPHNVTKDGGPGADFASDTVDAGGKYSQKFTVAGKVDYVCTIHPNQTGSVTVK